MSRPKALGGARGWSLAQLASAANLTRGNARSAQAHGFVQAPYEDIDVVLLKVAHTCLMFPDPDTHLGYLGHRDRAAVHLTRAAATHKDTTADTALVLSDTSAELTQLVPPHTPHYPAPGFPPKSVWPQNPAQRVPLVTLPVGAWLAAHVLRQTPLQFPALRPPRSLDDDPFGDYAVAR